MKRVIIASNTDDFIYVLLRNGDPIAKGSYEAMSKKSIDMAVPTDIKKFSKSKFNGYFKMAKDASRPNPLKFAVNRYINDNRDEFREINSATNIEDDFIYDLATRFAKFWEDFDTYDFYDSLNVGETIDDVIERTAQDLYDRRHISEMIEALNEWLSEYPDMSSEYKDTIDGLINDISKLA